MPPSNTQLEGSTRAQLGIISKWSAQQFIITVLKPSPIRPRSPTNLDQPSIRCLKNSTTSPLSALSWIYKSLASLHLCPSCVLLLLALCNKSRQTDQVLRGRASQRRL